MEGYLGETPVKQEETEEFKDFKAQDWAMYFVERYGQYDGSHHKQWVLDQIARILKGTLVEIKIAKWNNESGVVTTEYRVSTSENVSKEYLEWVESMKGEFDEEDGYEYDYDEGIAP